MVSALGAGPYFAILEDDGSFCVHNGTYPDTDNGKLWCATTGVRDAGLRLKSPLLGAYPTDCPLKDWQSRGQDAHSVVADPLFKDPDNGDFTLAAGSPALKLGFKNIDTSTIGPRPKRL